MTPAVEFKDVTRHYGKVRAVDGVSIAVREGEFFSMLGPSGSGKTTCLRLIAGFEQPSSGSIRIHGVEAAGVPPFERDVNTVFQDYALFPHMNVRDNVAYGLMVKGVEQGGALSPAAPTRWRWWRWKPMATASPRNFPADSGNASRWLARWSTGHACCCWTNRLARWTSSCASRCRAS